MARSALNVFVSACGYGEPPTKRHAANMHDAAKKRGNNVIQRDTPLREEELHNVIVSD